MAKNTAGVLKRLRALLKNTTYVTEPLNAYIVLSEDCHQVLYLNLNKVTIFGLENIKPVPPLIVAF